jgi:hypothetical protein
MVKFHEYDVDDYITAWWFQPTPLKNMGSSVGAMTLPIKGHIMKNTLW